MRKVTIVKILMIKKPKMKVIVMMKVMKKIAMIILKQRRRVKKIMEVKAIMKLKAIMKAVKMMMKALTTEIDCILIGSKKARYRLSKIIRIPVVISTGPTPLL